ncbi:MAG TPA: hypothetical protein VI796_07155 [Candidatus Thermoplasmatota archaeon]|nr:hypothetical protein [Candidatus Thermoplasmatota archaeon]
MSSSIFHLEPFRQFLVHAVELNRVHAPDEPVHAVILAQQATKEAGGELGEPDPATLEGRALAARRGLVALHHQFPAGAPVWEQAAYLVRGFAGLAPFPEANVRTGLDLVGELLLHHGHEVMLESDDTGALRDELWGRLEATYPNGMGRQDLLRRDDLLGWLADWFRHRTAVSGRARQA